MTLDGGTATNGSAVVTGGAGFLGGYVVRALLDDGWEVHVLDLVAMSKEIRFVVGADNDRLHLHSGSIEDWPTITELLAGVRPSAVVHMAAIVNTTWLGSNPFAALRVNVGGTLNVLEAARQSGVRRVVYFSSLGALAPRQYEPIDANHPTILARESSGTGFYGSSKLASEAFCFAYVSTYDLDVRIVRPSMAYGLGMPSGRATSDMRELVEGAVEGRPVHLATGASLRRGFTHAADIASLTAALLRPSDISDRIFYGAAGTPLPTTRDIVDAIVSLIPSADIDVEEGLTPSQELEARYRGQLDISNAVEQLGWKPRYADISSGVRRYIEDYRAYRASAATR